MNTVFVGKMSVRSKRHVPQIVNERFVCSCCEAVKDCPQLFVLSAINVHGYRIARFRCSRGMEPICGRKLYGAAFQMRMGNLVVLFGRYLVLHGRICHSGDSQFTIQTRLIKRHGFGTISIKQQERGEIYHIGPFWFSYSYLTRRNLRYVIEACDRGWPRATSAVTSLLILKDLYL